MENTSMLERGMHDEKEKGNMLVGKSVNEVRGVGRNAEKEVAKHERTKNKDGDKRFEKKKFTQNATLVSTKSGGLRCFRCGHEGHLSNSPGLLAVCKRCGKKGHYARLCRLKQQTVSCIEGEEKLEEKCIFSIRDDECVDTDPIEMPDCETVVGGNKSCCAC
ncbi:hypothetical protein NDU88_000320 [Pleurodeles waltl]|uniref:CCHC-type domain-containing protein n=1 Tax=Pleurodeles waltl TaxID=8319 RepID=A0AAV7VXS4_PLEWA|nr:hypothetical protein NDU88_000320 [Pleurodeles waltl]